MHPVARTPSGAARSSPLAGDPVTEPPATGSGRPRAPRRRLCAEPQRATARSRCSTRTRRSAARRGAPLAVAARLRDVAAAAHRAPQPPGRRRAVVEARAAGVRRADPRPRALARCRASARRRARARRARGAAGRRAATGAAAAPPSGPRASVSGATAAGSQPSIVSSARRGHGLAGDRRDERARRCSRAARAPRAAARRRRPRPREPGASSSARSSQQHEVGRRDERLDVAPPALAQRVDEVHRRPARRASTTTARRCAAAASGRRAGPP